MELRSLVKELLSNSKNLKYGLSVDKLFSETKKAAFRKNMNFMRELEFKSFFGLLSKRLKDIVFLKKKKKLQMNPRNKKIENQLTTIVVLKNTHFY